MIFRYNRVVLCIFRDLLIYSSYVKKIHSQKNKS